MKKKSDKFVTYPELFGMFFGLIFIPLSVLSKNADSLLVFTFMFAFSFGHILGRLK